jgi:hypothetical protein
VELPRVLEKLGKIDLFHHDSLHTYEHMTWEYETAFRYLDPSGAISSDDVNVMLNLTRPFQHCPFLDFAERHHWMSRTACKLGVTVNGSPAAARLRWHRIHGPGAVEGGKAQQRLRELERPFKIA